MNHAWPAWERWDLPSPEEKPRPPTEITSWSQRLWKAINKRAAYEAGMHLIPPCEDEFEQRFYDSSGCIREVEYLGDGTFLLRDRFGCDFLAAISRQEDTYFLSVKPVVLTVLKGVSDEPGHLVFATHHTVDTLPGGLSDVVEGPIEQAFGRLLAMLNELIERSGDGPRGNLRYAATMRHLPYVDSGALSYTLGILGAALFMATSIGPGWAGFLASYLPTSILTTLATAAHE